MGVALFVLGRFPVLFVRQRLNGLLGPPYWPDWELDSFAATAFIGVEFCVLALAVRKVRLSVAFRQPLLMTLLLWTWASTMWSIEPGATLWHASTFIGTAIVGWYLGAHFAERDQVTIVAVVAAVGAAGSIIAVLVIPDVAQRTNDRWGLWSGIYQNRNALALTMAMGVLAATFILASSRGRLRLVVGAVMALELFLLFRAGSRTEPLALAGSLVIAAAIYTVRRVGKGVLTARGGAALATAFAASGLVVVRLSWSHLVLLVGRDATLSHRTVIWAFDRWLFEIRPLTGLGFEGIWSNPLLRAQITGQLGRFPYASDSGYYETAVGLGVIGLLLMAAFLGLSVYRAFMLAWRRDDIVSLWPVTFLVFALSVNFTTSLFVSNEAIWALTVAAAVIARRTMAQGDGVGGNVVRR